MKNFGLNISENDRLKYNEKYLAKQLEIHKEYFDHMFDKIDPNILLDVEQRLAILTNEDYNLIVAGAGAGKTTTMIAKIKYMVDKCDVNPGEILAISFAKKNVEELAEKLKEFNLNVSTMTFHKLGSEILKLDTGHSLHIVTDSQRYNTVRDFFKNELYKDKSYLKKFVDFLYLYFKGDKEMESFNTLDEYHKYKVDNLFITVKERLKEYNQSVVDKREKYLRSIDSEYLRSDQEVTIANFLFLNGLTYEYESPYKYATNFEYRPDFYITQGENSVYLEHFGIHENGSSNFFTMKEKANYIKAINMKEQLHLRNGTKLIKTFSSYNDGRSLVTHLEELLRSNGFVLTPKTDKEIFDALTKTYIDSYFYKLTILILEFISKFKTDSFRDLNFAHLYSKTNDDRTIRFLELIEPIFNYYSKNLTENSYIDFEDMITMAVMTLEKNKDFKPFNYKYILIDEYQDMSKERYDLIKELVDHCDAQLIGIGDDWQSIFGFSGANVSLFSEFIDKLGYGEIIRIKNTYRNSQELIDTASKFVSQDSSLLNKRLFSKKRLNKPIVVYSYDDTRKKSEPESIFTRKAIAIEKAIGDILSINPNANIMLIGRYNFDKYHLCEMTDLFKSGAGNEVISKKYPNAYLKYFTCHKSKGLEFDYTIIINAIDATYGFPSKIKDDNIFSVFSKPISNISFAEERRLFYVALTRTKNKVYIIAPNTHPSPFIVELYGDKNIEFKDDLKEIYTDSVNRTKCPICGYPLVKAFSKSVKSDFPLYICSNEKELCSFKCNDITHKINIEKCSSCSDGHLVVKKVTDEYIMLGCTNYNNPLNNCENTKFIHFK